MDVAIIHVTSKAKQSLEHVHVATEGGPHHGIP